MQQSIENLIQIQSLCFSNLNNMFSYLSANIYYSKVENLRKIIGNNIDIMCIAETKNITALLLGTVLYWKVISNHLTSI